MKNLNVITQSDMVRRTGLSVATIWRMEKRGELPPRKQIGKTKGWFQYQIDEWAESLPTVKETA